MDELPTHLPDPSEIPKPKADKERFPYQVFANCIGADGFNIMGYRVKPSRTPTPNNINPDDDDDDQQQQQQRQNNKYNTNNKTSTTTTKKLKPHEKPLRLSRERLEAFLAMTRAQETSANTKSILGAVSWDNGTVLFPIGNEGDPNLLGASASASLTNTSKQPTPNSKVTGSGTAFSQNNIRKTSAAVPPPFAMFPNSNSKNTSNNLNNLENTNTNNNSKTPIGDVRSDVASTDGDTMTNVGPTESEFPQRTNTISQRETESLSAHSSDYGLAEAAAIAAATRGLNPMSAQAAALRAAAIQRREQRLKKRKEQAILARNIERCERFGLAGLDVPSLVAQYQSTTTATTTTTQKSRGCTPPPPFAAVKQQQQQQNVAGSGFSNRASPQNTMMPTQKTNSSSPVRFSSNNSQNNLAGPDQPLVSQQQQQQQENSSDSASATSSSQHPPSSMPDLQSATTSELGGRGVHGGNNKSVPHSPAVRTPVSQGAGGSLFPANASAAAFTSTTAKDRPAKSKTSPNTVTPTSVTQLQKGQKIQQHIIDDNSSHRLDDDDDDDQQQHDQSSKNTPPQRKTKDPTAVGNPVASSQGQGLSEADWKRLYKEEQRLMKNKIRVEDFGNKGRGVRSTAIINKGELIWRCRPHLGVLYNDYMKDHCAHCFRPSLQNRTTKSSSNVSQHVCLATTDSLQLCPFCESFALCNDCGGKPVLCNDEKSNHQHPSSTVSFLWRRHLDWCKWLRTLPESVRKGDTDYLRFLLEYASRVQSGDLEVVQAVAGLCSLDDVQSDEVKQFCESFSRLVATTFGGASGKGLSVSQSALKEALMRIKCNALGFPFTREATIGWAVHGTVCMLNHSCDANAALTQSPLGEMEIRAIQPISPGQEITISYIHVPDFKNKAERRKHLLTQYRFLCRCELCEKK